MPAFIDLTGQNFSRLTVLERGPNRKNVVRWYVQCQCGTITLVDANSLRHGNTRSCGCLNLDTIRTQQGKSRTKEYRAWSSMWQRCTKPAADMYPHYGGRGITVCSAWKNFNTFLHDLGICPKGHSIDRINNDGNYELSNCKWSTAVEQACNKSTNVYLTHAGETKTISQWARHTGILEKTLGSRLARNWSTEKALTKPVKKSK